MPNYLQAPRGRGGAGARLRRDAADLFGAMTTLLRVYQFRDRDRVGYHGLTITQSYVMEVVLRRGQVTLLALAAEMHLDKSTVSRVVDGLESKGAVRRVPNPRDGRSMLIQATASGRARYRRVEAAIVKENARVLSGVAPGVRRQLVDLIGKLARAARDRRLEPVAEDRL